MPLCITLACITLVGVVIALGILLSVAWRDLGISCTSNLDLSFDRCGFRPAKSSEFCSFLRFALDPLPEEYSSLMSVTLCRDGLSYGISRDSPATRCLRDSGLRVIVIGYDSMLTIPLLIFKLYFVVCVFIVAVKHVLSLGRAILVSVSALSMIGFAAAVFFAWVFIALTLLFVIAQ